jgi:predicted molibdopterin-dependent oxidoreductase YjgC
MGLNSDIPPETIFQKILDGDIKGLWIMGDDPLVSLPANRKIEEALEKLTFLIVSDGFLNGTGTHAHVVFPSATFAEKSGTLTNFEGRLQKVVKAIDCVGESRPDWKIVSHLAEHLGKPFPFKAEKEITREIIKTIPLYSGMNLSESDDGYFCYRPSVSLSQKKTTFFFPEEVSAVQKVTKEYPYTLIVGSILFHLGSGQQTRHSPRLSRIIQDEYVELNPEDAAQESIKEGEIIRVVSFSGEKKIVVRLTDKVPTGVLFMPLPFTWNSNLLPYGTEKTGANTCRVTIKRSPL